MNKYQGLILITLILFAAGATLYYLFNKESLEHITCTAETKVCPDGSFVARTGYDCQFEACPDNTKQNQEAIDPDTGWKVYTNKDVGIEFEYPSAPLGCEKSCKVNTDSFFNIGTVGFSIEKSNEPTLSLAVDEYIRDDFAEVSRKDKIIGGQEGLIVSYRFGGTGRFGEAAFVKKDNQIFIFDYRAGLSCCYDNAKSIYEEDVFETMVSTFRFLKNY